MLTYFDAFWDFALHVASPFTKIFIQIGTDGRSFLFPVRATGFPDTLAGQVSVNIARLLDLIGIGDIEPFECTETWSQKNNSIVVSSHGVLMVCHSNHGLGCTLRISEVPALDISGISKHSFRSCSLIKGKLIQAEVKIVLEIYSVVKVSVTKTIAVTTLTEHVDGVTHGSMLNHGRIVSEALNPPSRLPTSAMHPHDWAF